MTTYIFAIGGTGARVMRSLTMLLAAGCNGSTGNEIVPIILDYDMENGDKERTIGVMNLYKELHDIIYHGVTLYDSVDSFFSTEMNRICDKQVAGNQLNEKSGFAAFIPPTDTKITFSDYLGFKQMVNDMEPTQELLKALYDTSLGKNSQGEENPCAELNLNLDKGFKGCPNIGCIVTRHFGKLDEFKNALTCFSNGDRIFIIGSVFGGTGASGIPVLLDLLRHEPKTENAPIGVLAMMPYFKIEDKKDKGAISSHTFIAKTKAAVSAYDLKNSVYHQANDIYFIGDNYVKGMFAYAEGKKAQKNNALFAELAGAMCVLDFLSSTPSAQPTNNTESKAHEMGLTDEAPMAPSTDKTGAEEKEDSVKEVHFFPTEIEKYIDPLTKSVVFEKFCKEYIPNNTKKSDTWYNAINSGDKPEELKVFITKLHSFAEELFEWLKELEAKTRPLSLYHPNDDYEKFYLRKPLKKKWHHPAFKENDISQELCNAYTNFEDKIADKTSAYMFIRCAYDAMNNILKKIKNY